MQISGTTYAVTGNVDSTFQFKVVSASGKETIYGKPYTVRLASDTLKAFVSDINTLPNPNTAIDTQITGNSQTIKDLKILYDSLSSSEKDAVTQEQLDKLNKLLNRLDSLLVIVQKDEGTGIIAGNLGTSIQLEKELNDPEVSKVVVKLVVDPLSTSAAKQANVAIATQTVEKSSQNILAAYDVSLFKSVYDTSGAVMSDGKVSNSDINAAIVIQIPVPSQYAGRTDLQMVYIDDSGNVTPLATTLVTIDGVQYLQFTTTHFSVYAITAQQQPIANPKTGNNSSPIEFALPVFLLAFYAATMKSVRRKRNNRNFR